MIWLLLGSLTELLCPYAHYVITHTFHSSESKGGELNNKGTGERRHRLGELIINCL